MIRKNTLETHGYCGTPTYLVWRNMRRRCYNPANVGFKDYGGRGITVCDKWKGSFLAFLADMGERPEGMEIDRIDNDLGYSPENCQWVNRLQNSRNRRTSVVIEYQGRSLPLAEWSKIIGIKYHILRNRIFECKWPTERAFSEPVGKSSLFQ